MRSSVQGAAFRTAMAIAAAAAVGAWPGAARAADMDPSPERFVLQPPGLPAGQTCQSIARDPEIALRAGAKPIQFLCRPDQSAFRSYVGDLGFAIAPSAFHPARTTGFGGFLFAFQADFTPIDPKARSASGAAYWKTGTQGAADPNTRTFPPFNGSPDSLLTVYSLTARKGLPFGFEFGGSFGALGNTSLWVAGGDFRWALLEGFRKGTLGYLPDVAAGGGVRTITGSSKFTLTTVGIDAQISKPIPVADRVVVTPWAGFQRLVIFGDSATVDATPDVDPLQRCGYQGPSPSTGAPMCSHKLSDGTADNADFNNNFIFAPVRIHRNRGIVGLQFRYEVLLLGSQIAFDLTDPSSEGNGIQASRLFTVSFEGGLQF